MQYIIAALLLPSACLSSGNLTEQVSRPDTAVVEKLIADHAIVGFSWVDQPINRILLIKNGKDRCAIKYSSFSMSKDQRKSTAFRSGDAVTYATAELLLPSLKTRRLKLQHKPLYGLGKIGYSPSKHLIRCGRARLNWGYPTATTLSQNDSVTTLAPTSWTRFDEIDFAAPELEWFGYEEGRRIVVK